MNGPSRAAFSMLSERLPRESNCLGPQALLVGGKRRSGPRSPARIEKKRVGFEPRMNRVIPQYRDKLAVKELCAVFVSTCTVQAAKSYRIER